MILFIINHYKAVIAICGAIIAALVTYLVSPSIAVVAGFVLSTTQTKATVQEHIVKIQKLESAVYGIDGKFDLIQKSLKIMEERNYQELKEARQRRRSEKY